MLTDEIMNRILTLGNAKHRILTLGTAISSYIYWVTTEMI